MNTRLLQTGLPRIAPEPRIARPYPMHDGTSIGAVEYIAGANNCTALSTLALVTNTFYCVPFVSPPYLTRYTRFSCEVTAAAGTNLYINLYESQTLTAGRALPSGASVGLAQDYFTASQVTAGPDVYLPGRYIAGSTVSSASTGLKSIVPIESNRRYLQPSQLYWLAMVCDGAATVRALAVGGIEHAGLVTSGTTALIVGLSGLAVTLLDGMNDAGGLVPLAVRTSAVMPVMRYQLERVAA